MNITVLFFATLKDLAGTDRITLEVADHATVSDLKDLLAALLPELEPSLSTTLAAVNQEFAFTNDILPVGAEVALFPPVSGGAQADPNSDRPTLTRVTGGTLDFEELLTSITLPATGAICLFTGIVRANTVRNDSQHRVHNTDYLEYEAYVPMAETKMQQVVEEIREKWPTVEGVAIVQRVGEIYPGTPTVMIACSAAHRNSGVFDAARYGIDRLKEIVPVWKKEYGPDGVEWLEGSYIPQEQDR